jgi:hypothetical protein
MQIVLWIVISIAVIVAGVRSLLTYGEELRKGKSPGHAALAGLVWGLITGSYWPVLPFFFLGRIYLRWEDERAQRKLQQYLRDRDREG